jgi:hypothetical protein
VDLDGRDYVLYGAAGRLILTDEFFNGPLPAGWQITQNQDGTYIEVTDDKGRVFKGSFVPSDKVDHGGGNWDREFFDWNDHFNRYFDERRTFSHNYRADGRRHDDPENSITRHYKNSEGSPALPEGEPGIPSHPEGTLTKINDRYLKKLAQELGTTAHELKQDLVPGKLSRFDLYLDKAGNIWAKAKGLSDETAEWVMKLPE